MRSTTPVLAVLIAAACGGCSAVEGPGAPLGPAARSSSGGPAPWRWTREGGSMDAPAAADPGRPPSAWQWTIESGPAPAGATIGGEALAGGLRVAVGSVSPLPGRTETHALEEGVPAPVVVGVAAWPADAPPAPEVPGLAGPSVRVEWLVTLRARGCDAVEVEAVPRLTGATGCSGLAEAWRVRRTVPLGQALVVGTDGGPRTAPTAAALAGAASGGAGRFAIRVRP